MEGGVPIAGDGVSISIGGGVAGVILEDGE